MPKLDYKATRILSGMFLCFILEAGNKENVSIYSRNYLRSFKLCGVKTLILNEAVLIMFKRVMICSQRLPL